MRFQGSVEHGSSAQWGRTEGRLLASEKPVRGYQASASDWASRVRFSLLTGAWNECSLPELSFEKRNHITSQVINEVYIEA